MHIPTFEPIKYRGRLLIPGGVASNWIEKAQLIYLFAVYIISIGQKTTFGKSFSVVLYKMNVRRNALDLKEAFFSFLNGHFKEAF